MAKLIRQFLTESASVSKDENKNYFIEGTFIVAEEGNKNRRKYPRKLLEKEIESYVNDVVNDNRAYGELMHPTGSDPSINMERVSHRIISLTQDENIWIGKAIVADTDKGKIVKALIDIGGKLGVSSRGLGSLKEENDFQVVQDDFKLITAADIVYEPSAPGAWVEAVMEDAKEWYRDLDGNWKEVFCDYKEEIHQTKQNLLEEKYKELFLDFLSRLSKSKN